MLEQKDIEILKTMITEIVGQSENNMSQKMDERISKSEQNMSLIMDERISRSEQNMSLIMNERMNERSLQLRESILQEVDKRISHSENLILNELDRVQEHTKTDFQKLQKSINEIQQYYRIAKLENDNTSLLLKMYSDMQKDIAELKSQTA